MRLGVLDSVQVSTTEGALRGRLSEASDVLGRILTADGDAPATAEVWRAGI